MMTARMTAVALALVLCASVALAGENEPQRPDYERGRKLCTLDNRLVSESSGLACSRRNKGVFWTHNDSGDKPQVYAFDKQGHDLATYRIKGAAHTDWEDIASFELDGKAYLLIGDIGDNLRRREWYYVYIVEEPEIDTSKRGVRGELKPSKIVQFQFAGGSEDGEGVAVDTTEKVIYVAVRKGRSCPIFAFKLPAEKKATARAALVARLPIHRANAIDIAPDGSRAVVHRYGRVYEYARSADEHWPDAFKRKPRVFKTPDKPKGESAAYGTDGKTLYLTSEGRPCPVWEVPVKD
ncbi:MAG: hypothetical protein ACOC8E_05285 [Planctomycetota bacterium]